MIKHLKLTAITFLLFVSCSNAEKDPYPEFTIPVVDKSYDVSINLDESIFGKSVSYYVVEKFPALNTIQFYESFLSKKGFNELENYKYGGKNWLNSNGVNAAYPPARTFRAWLDSSENLMFKLTLTYANNKDELSVICFLHPHSKHHFFEKFDKWVSEMEKEQEVIVFLSNYRMPNAKVDLERALEENPNNELISRFAEAARKDKQDIAEAYKAYRETIQKNE